MRAIEYSFPENLKKDFFIKALILIGIFIGTGIMLIILPNNSGNNSQLWLIFIAFATSLFFVYILLFYVKSKFSIEQNRFVKYNVFSKQIIQFEDVAGYRANSGVIRIIPKDVKRKSIVIPITFENSQFIENKLSEKYVNLDVDEFNLEITDVLSNKRLGNISDRELHVRKIKYFVYALNVLSVIFPIVTIFSPYFKEILIWICILIPLLGFLLIYYEPRLVKFDSENDNYFRVIWCFLLPTWLLVQIAYKFKIYEYTNLWKPLLFLTFWFFIFLYRLDTFKMKGGKQTLTNVAIILFISVFLFSDFVIINCMHDNSVPKVIKASIVRKWSNFGKGPSNFIVIKDWNGKYKELNIAVPSKLWMEVNDADSVSVNLHEGVFNIPWFSISKNE